MHSLEETVVKGKVRILVVESWERPHCLPLENSSILCSLQRSRTFLSNKYDFNSPMVFSSEPLVCLSMTHVTIFIVHMNARDQERSIPLQNQGVDSSLSVFIVGDDKVLFGSLLASGLLLPVYNTSWLFYHTASLYWRLMGNASQALNCLFQSHLHSPADVQDLTYLSMALIIYNSQLHVNEAIYLLYESLAVDRSALLLTHFTLGNAMARKSHLKWAEKWYQSALKLKADFEPAKQRLRAIQCWQCFNYYLVLAFISHPSKDYSFLSLRLVCLGWTVTFELVCQMIFFSLRISILSNEWMNDAKIVCCFRHFSSSHFSDQHGSLAFLRSEVISLLLHHLCVGHRSISPTWCFLLLSSRPFTRWFRIRAWQRQPTAIQRSPEGWLQPTGVQLLDSRLSLCRSTGFRWNAIHDQSKTVLNNVSARRDGLTFRWRHYGREWSSPAIWNAIQWWTQRFIGMSIVMTNIDGDTIFKESHSIFRCCYVEEIKSVSMLFVSIDPWYRNIYLSEISIIPTVDATLSAVSPKGMIINHWCCTIFCKDRRRQWTHLGEYLANEISWRNAHAARVRHATFLPGEKKSIAKDKSSILNAFPLTVHLVLCFSAPS